MSDRPTSGAGRGGGGGNVGAGDRPLNVADALGYLDAVKIQFSDKPNVYNHFLDIMKDFKSQVIDTPGVIERVSTLFQGNPFLIQGFNTFLPPGYRIDVSSDPRNQNTIMVTTPAGTMTTNTMDGTPVRLTRDSLLNPGVHTPVPTFPSHPPFGGPAPPPILPVGLGPGSRPTSPLGHHPAHLPQHLDRPLHPNPFSLDVPHPYSPATQGAQAAATVLGGMGGSGSGGKTVEKTGAEFNHAIQFLNKIKNTYSDDGDVYRQFLDILQTYQKENKELYDSQVFAQVSRLFKDTPDLMEEFKAFLPATLGPIPPYGPGGLVGIMPHPTNGHGGPAGWDMDGPVVEKPKAPSRRKKRALDKEPSTQLQAATKGTGSRSTKKAKLNHGKPDAANPPQFSPYQLTPSPDPAHAHRNHPLQQHPSQVHPMHMQIQRAMPPPGLHVYPSGMSTLSTQEELMFFDRTKKALENGGTYEEFLKLLNLFAKDVIDTKTLIKRAEAFLTDGDLLYQFKELMGWDDKRGNIEFGPPGSIRTSAPDPTSAWCPDDDEGPSYRKLPLHETRLACSGRDQLAWSVLNDEWVSHPTWASEEAGFLTHKKNSFEETLHRSEEERHEYQVHIEAIMRTIAVLDPLEARIDEMSAEERAQLKLGPELGGWSPSIYQKVIKKVYGRDAGQEVYRALQEYPGVAVPVVLARLKQKSEEWRRLQREWNRTWREVDAKNFYKALDHQGITFKNNDKKNITAKYFMQDIESVKAAQESDPSNDKPFNSPGYQLEYELDDTEVLQDSLKLIYSFLDHSTTIYSVSERRGIEEFLRAFIPTLYSFSLHDFNAACGPLQPAVDDQDMDDAEEIDCGAKSSRSGRHSAAGNHSAGIPAGDLRKRLLKTVQEGSISRAAKQSNSNSADTESPPAEKNSSAGKASSGPHDDGAEMPADGDRRSNTDEAWIGGIPLVEHGQGSTPMQAGETLAKKRPFFGGTTFYTLLRLIQLLYSRLLRCKKIGAQLAKEKHASLLANPVAIELGLDEPNGPSVILAQAIEAIGENAGEDTNVLYIYLLEACEKVFANELDQATFEEHMRWFFRATAYHCFTLDKVITAIIKQVQTIQGDNRCQELWHLLQATRKQDDLTLYDIIRYRREAERHVGADDHLYRIDCDRTTKALRIQLLGAEDPSADEDNTAVGRWREYCATYVSQHPTEWLPPRAAEKQSRPYLKRTLINEDQHSTGIAAARLSVRVSLGTYKLFYAADREDVYIRRRTDEREHVLRARALAREEERRRSRWLK
ncbi:hypothetical protein BDW22DRAFT_1319555 [Trametopsis cervina]|nr:hypothetical protein BDW22DRAFT_1319555 [Trametopsis cervina]